MKNTVIHYLSSNYSHFQGNCNSRCFIKFNLLQDAKWTQQTPPSPIKVRCNSKGHVIMSVFYCFTDVSEWGVFSVFLAGCWWTQQGLNLGFYSHVAACLTCMLCCFTQLLWEKACCWIACVGIYALRSTNFTEKNEESCKAICNEDVCYK